MKKIELDKLISYELKIGVIISAVIVLVGLFLAFTTNGSDISINIITVGVFVLFATPVIRVIMSVFLFAVERNALYTIITIIVLINLLFAIFVAPSLI